MSTHNDNTYYRAKQWVDSVANLTSNNPTLANREMVFDELGLKISSADNTTWTTIPYFLRKIEFVNITPTKNTNISYKFNNVETGRIVIVTNTGPVSNKYKLTNCPDSISIGSGQTVMFFRSPNKWVYPSNTIIDDYEQSATLVKSTVRKWANGVMRISVLHVSSDPGTFDFRQPFASSDDLYWINGGTNITIQVVPPTATQYRIKSIDHTGAVTGQSGATYTGRWR